MSDTKKLTKRDVINSMLADANIKGNADYVAYLTNELSLIDKKAAKAKSAPKKADVLKDAILNALTSDAISGADMATKVGTTKAKATARLSALVRDGKAAKSTVKVDKKNVVVYTIA